jgi:hypothetical protein
MTGNEQEITSTACYKTHACVCVYIYGELYIGVISKDKNKN